MNLELQLSTQANKTLQRTAAPLGSRTVQLICQRLLQPTGRFRRRVAELFSLGGITRTQKEHHE